MLFQNHISHCLLGILLFWSQIMPISFFVCIILRMSTGVHLEGIPHILSVCIPRYKPCDGSTDTERFFRHTTEEFTAEVPKEAREKEKNRKAEAKATAKAKAQRAQDQGQRAQDQKGSYSEGPATSLQCWDENQGEDRAVQSGFQAIEKLPHWARHWVGLSIASQEKEVIGVMPCRRFLIQRFAFKPCAFESRQPARLSERRVISSRRWKGWSRDCLGASHGWDDWVRRCASSCISLSTWHPSLCCHAL